MSSLISLGLSVIFFIICYGIGFMLVAAILGAFFSVAGNVPISDPSWAAVYLKQQTTLKFLVPLVPTIGIFLLVLKVLMVASARGRD